MGVLAWVRGAARRIRGEDLLERSDARLEEAEAGSTESKLGRVAVQEEATRERARIYRVHGWGEAAALEHETATALAEHRRGLESRRAREREIFGDDVAFDVMGED